jgi:hypothetical protein
MNFADIPDEKTDYRNGEKLFKRRGWPNPAVCYHQGMYVGIWHGEKDVEIHVCNPEDAKEAWEYSGELKDCEVEELFHGINEDNNYRARLQFATGTDEKGTTVFDRNKLQLVLSKKVFKKDLPSVVIELQRSTKENAMFAFVEIKAHLQEKENTNSPLTKLLETLSSLKQTTCK